MLSFTWVNRDGLCKDLTDLLLALTRATNLSHSADNINSIKVYSLAARQIIACLDDKDVFWNGCLVRHLICRNVCEKVSSCVKSYHNSSLHLFFNNSCLLCSRGMNVSHWFIRIKDIGSNKRSLLRFLFGLVCFCILWLAFDIIQNNC